MVTISGRGINLAQRFNAATDPPCTIRLRDTSHVKVIKFLCHFVASSSNTTQQTKIKLFFADFEQVFAHWEPAIILGGAHQPSWMALILRNSMTIDLISVNTNLTIIDNIENVSVKVNMIYPYALIVYDKSPWNKKWSSLLVRREPLEIKMKKNLHYWRGNHSQGYCSVSYSMLTRWRQPIRINFSYYTTGIFFTGVIYKLSLLE